MKTAISRRPSPRMQSGERTFVGRDAINPALALVQHANYIKALESCGYFVNTIASDDALPDCVFVEDCAVVLPESALLCRPGAASRVSEVEAVARCLSNDRPAVRVEAPATVEGGDVLRLHRRILVGQSQRTNPGGISTLRQWAKPFGYHVDACAVHGCLHLKTACTFLPDGSLLANLDWVEVPNDLQIVNVPVEEPWAGNVVLARQTIIAARNQPKTNHLLRDRGFRVIEVDISEFQKAEGGVTCLSILMDQPQ